MHYLHAPHTDSLFHPSRLHFTHKANRRCSRLTRILCVREATAGDTTNATLFLLRHCTTVAMQRGLSLSTVAFHLRSVYLPVCVSVFVTLTLSPTSASLCFALLLPPPSLVCPQIVMITQICCFLSLGCLCCIQCSFSAQTLSSGVTMPDTQ